MTRNEPSHSQEAVDVEAAFIHDMYERAARDAGWVTQAASRCLWRDVPEANKDATRAIASWHLAALARARREGAEEERGGLAKALAAAHRQEALARKSRTAVEQIVSGLPCYLGHTAVQNHMCHACKARDALAALPLPTPPPAATPRSVPPEDVAKIVAKIDSPEATATRAAFDACSAQPTAAPAQPAEGEREAFEAWPGLRWHPNANGPGLMDRDPYGGYYNTAVEYAWRAWQARAGRPA